MCIQYCKTIFIPNSIGLTIIPGILGGFVGYKNAKNIVEKINIVPLMLMPVFF